MGQRLRLEETGMKTNSTCRGALVLALFASCPSMAADPPLTLPPTTAPTAPPPAQTGKNPLPDVLPTPAAGLPTRADGLPMGSVASPWMEYSRPDCCGPLGGGPIGFEYYTRTGPSIPVANGILNATLDTGWMSQIGARSLFFNPSSTKAWTVDAGLSYTYNNSGASNVVWGIPLPVITGFNPDGTPTIVVQNVNVTTRDYQRWSFNVAAGRDWYLMKPAYDSGWHWRVGWDVGGRWGYGRLELNDLTTLPTRIGFRHVGDTFGAMALGIREDIEIPLRNCASFICGVRAEWVYNWTDIVPANVGRDLQDVNILANFGFRY